MKAPRHSDKRSSRLSRPTTNGSCQRRLDRSRKSNSWLTWEHCDPYKDGLPFRVSRANARQHQRGLSLEQLGVTGVTGVTAQTGLWRVETIGAALLREVENYYRRYVVFPPAVADAEVTILSLWVMHSWAFGAAEATPYLLVTAPTPEAGKSRVIDVSLYLCREPEVVSDPTPASLYRLIQATPGITLFIDEVDVLVKSPAIRNVLNSGYRMGTPISRALKVNGIWMTEKLNVFCPKMFAGISGERLPLTGATLSRCIEIPMQRKLESEGAEKFFHRSARLETRPLREQLEAWAAEHLPVLAQMQPSLPGLTDRQDEILSPLLAIADLAGGEWPVRARSAAVALTQRASRQPDPATQILADLKVVWDDIEGDRAHTKALVNKRNALPDPLYVGALTDQEMAKWLARFGIRPEPRPFRLGGEFLRGYRRQSFADAFDRYCPSHPSHP